MKILAITIGSAALLLPASAFAGNYNSYSHASPYYSPPQCQSTQNMQVACESGVTIYRAKPIQYAPGHLQAITANKLEAAENRRLRAKLAAKSVKLRAQKAEIADLEKRMEDLERSQMEVSNRRVYTAPVYGFNGGYYGPSRPFPRRASPKNSRPRGGHTGFHH